MTSVRAVARVVAFTVGVPAVLAAVVPFALAQVTLSPIGFDALLFDSALPVSAVGAVLMGLGVVCYALALSALVSSGASAPVPIVGRDCLVTGGIYAHLRNPMLVGIILYVLGAGLWLDSTAVVGYAGLLWTAFFLLVNGVEEKRLERTYGERYAHYCEHVSRWRPRLRPYEGAAVAPSEEDSSANEYSRSD
ncbi:methyltransferase family protein [Natrononativus amylolyticus]|uniref:methyltransferase family protein n=1 Tax=Natrononativus amylolyticus TaxID=2963434 RepID=UPI0020CE1AC4|nr:isoprenylcysteine carboxylmethyltransferase family protein [Natrononativus amylolyticus]